MTPFRFAAIAWLGLYSVVTGPLVAQTRDSAKAVSDVRAARLDQNRALLGHDLDRAASYWMPDVVITASLGRVLRGKDAYRNAFALDTTMVYERVPERIDVSGNWPLAWEEGSWTGRRGRAGPVLIKGRYAAQWQQHEGHWLIRAELFVGQGCTGEACAWPLVSP